MADYTLSTTSDASYDDTVAAVRQALADQGFGVLTEIDVRATLHEKLGVEIEPQVILGACRPPLAYQALQADPSVATLLPCNVVVRAVGTDSGAGVVVVEALDPRIIASMSDDEALHDVAEDARTRLAAALDALGSS